MTCGEKGICNLCDTTAAIGPRHSSTYEGKGNLADEVRTGRVSHKPHVRLCTGCLERALRKEMP